jgi:hypothetical protein
MSINQNKYVSITSGVGAATVVPTRQLIGRFFTDNILLPPQSFLEFSNTQEVGDYFGFNSNEYLRSVFYFSFVSKNITTPQTISFARWVDTAVAPMIFGVPNPSYAASLFSTITTGSMGITINGVQLVLSDISFSGDSNLTEVASTLQSAIQTGSGQMFTSATVTYNAIGNQFVFLGGVATTAPITIQAGTTGVDITGLIGFAPNALGNPIICNGSAVETISQTLTTSAGLSNNFGSFAFMPTIPLTLAQNQSAAEWNNTQNILYMFSIPVIAANASTWSEAFPAGLGQIGGCTLTLNLSPVAQTGTLTNGSQTITGLDTSVLNVGMSISASTSTTLTGTLASDLTVTGISSTAAIAVGMAVSGTGIPTGTVVTAIISGTEISISQNATVSSSESLTFTGSGLSIDTTITSIASGSSVTISPAAIATGSESLTFYPSQYPEMFPMMILAATNYNNLNSVQNYMFQQVAGLTPTVTSDSLSATMDGYGINYYGQTQTAGQFLSFYQRGVMMGLPVDPLDQNVYANEQWLKDAASAALMNLLLALPQIPANSQGRTQILSILQSVINQALNNGTISVGKTLNTTQQLYIAQVTGDPNAAYQVQTTGYWVNCVIVPSTTNPVTYTAQYILVYSKDDVIRMIDGTHDLI